MAEAQINNIPHDANAEKVDLVPRDWGEPKVLNLTVPSGDYAKLSDADDYPVADADKSAPELVEWWLVNRSAIDVIITDSAHGTGTATPAGLHLGAGNVTPEQIKLTWDPETTYVYNSGQGDIDLTLVLVGRFPS